MTARRGPVERAYRAWVATLGRLSPRQAATAEQVYALAAQIDAAAGEPLSAVSAASRELRQVAADLRDASMAGSAVPTAPLDVVDEVARQRKARQDAARRKT